MTRLWLPAVLVSANAALACAVPEGAVELRADTPDAPAAYASLAAPPVSAPFDIEVTLCLPSDQKVAALAFDATMPAHQHGMNYDPRVVRSAHGAFSVSNVVFHMPGAWQIEIEAVIPDQRLRYTGNIEVK
ncbi:MAG: hypothetical protein AAGF79_17640 [Pseudomonadota bacterium]